MQRQGSGFLEGQASLVTNDDAYDQVLNMLSATLFPNSPASWISSELSALSRPLHPHLPPQCLSLRLIKDYKIN